MAEREIRAISNDFAGGYFKKGRKTMKLHEASEQISALHEAAAQNIAHYGAAHQLVKLCEECGELIQLRRIV
jgi:hypothetical protein